MDFYETTRKFENFDDFLRISALITEEYGTALKQKDPDSYVDVHSIEDIIQGPAQNWPGLNNNSIDRLNVSFAWQYKLSMPGPVMFIQWKAKGTYLYQFQKHGVDDKETKLLYGTAISVFNKESIEEVKKH